MVIEPLSTYIAGALQRPLPDLVVERAGHHILDSLAAVVSGSRLPAGRAGQRFATRNLGAEEALIAGTRQITSATNAALANAMAGHADETDDSHEPSRSHPGCAIVPTALAIAERDDRSGTDLLRAVTLGYDLAGRMSRAMWPDYMTLRAQVHATHSIGALWGSAATAAALGGLEATDVRYLLSYTAQQTSGITTWLRDVEHIEKAFAFAGLGAANALRALTFVEAGWPGVRDVFAGQPNFFQAFGVDPDPDFLVSELGERYVIAETNIKRFSVGSPIQAPLQGLIDLCRDEDIDRHRITRVDVTLPDTLADVVFDRDMPDIALPYLVSVALDDGDVNFANSHDEERFAMWQQQGDDRVVLHRDLEMEPIRQAVVVVTLDDGTTHTRHETAVRGTAQNPMTTDEVAHKARDLCTPILGADRTERLVDTVLALDGLPSVRSLRGLLEADPDGAG